MSEPQGCTYQEHKDGMFCNKVCDPPQKMCPHHILLTEEMEKQKAKRERARAAEAARIKKVRGRR